MGMFDSFYLLGSSVGAVKCAAGHDVTGELQTKALNCEMATYYVFDGFLFGKDGVTTEKRFAIADDRLVRTSIASYAPYTFTGTVEVHTFCEICEPVCYERPATSHFGSVGMAHPWIEWGLVFVSGKLTSAEPYRNETRDDVRATLAKHGNIPLPDDDRVVQRELQRWREGKR